MPIESVFYQQCYITGCDYILKLTNTRSRICFCDVIDNYSYAILRQ